MASKLRSYPDKYDWVKVKSNRKHNLGKREWNGQTNVPIKEGEELILPRGSSDPDENLSGMKYYFKNGFYEVIDPEPELPSNDTSESAPEDNDDNTNEEVNCPECDRSFDSERGMKQHKRQVHENNDEGE